MSAPEDGCGFFHPNMLRSSQGWRKVTSEALGGGLLLWSCLCPAFAAWDRFPVISTQIPIEGISELSFINTLEGWGVISPTPLRVVHTLDGGQTWQEVYRNTDLSSLPLEPRLHLQFVSSTEGWMTPNATWGADKLFHTTNGGIDWEERVHPFQATFSAVHAVWFANQEVGWIAGEDSGLAGMIAATTDGGATWSVRPTPYQFTALDLFFLDDQHGWVVGRDGAVLFSKDGGVTWELGYTRSLADLYCVRFADPQNGWAVGSEGTILFSRDGGFRWYAQPSGTEAELYDIAVGSTQEAVVVGNLEYTEGLALVTRNGGATWRRENLPATLPLYSAAWIGSDLWLSGGSIEADQAFEAQLLHRQFQSGEYPVILVDSLPGGTVGIPYEVRFTARDGTPPYSWSILSGETLGLSIEGSSGLLSGVPTSATQAVFTVEARDSGGKTDVREMRIRVVNQPLSFQTSTLPRAIHRKTYRFPLDVSGGHQPYRWRFLGDLVPPGFSVDHQSVLIGTPFEVGSFDFQIEVTDSGSLPQRVTLPFHLEVDSLPEGGWEIQHASNRITDIHFFDPNHGIAIGWSGLVYDTRDGGRSWNHRDLGWTAWDFDWIGEEGWVVASEGIGHTSNRGVDWTFQPLGFSPDGIAFHDALHGWVYGSGIAYTEDGGATWHPADAPGGYYFALDFADSLHGFAGGNNFLFAKSEDGGHTWEESTLPPFSAKSIQPCPPRNPDVSLPDKAEKIPQIMEVYFVDAQVGWIGTNVIEGYSPLLYRTANGGQDWEKRSVGGKGTIDQFQFLPDGLHAWMGGLFSGDFYRTLDGGLNWEEISFGSSTHILGFHFLDANTGWVLPNVVGRIDDTNTIQDLEGSIWKTQDGGRNFYLQYGWPMEGPDIGEDFPEQYNSPGPEFLSMSFADAEHGWALGRHTFGSSSLPARLFFTDSGGADWRVLSRVEYGLKQICFANDRHGFALHTSHSLPVFETQDGGATWFPRQDILQLLDGGFDSNWGEVAFADDQFGWIVFNGDYTLYEGTRVLLRTTDGGVSWEMIHENERGGLHHLFFLDRNHGWMVNDFGFIEATTDGGETWTDQRTLSEGWVKLQGVHFADEYSGWAVGLAGTVLSTTNGGETWNLDTGPGGSADVFDVYFSTCLKGWFVGEDNPFPDADPSGDPVLVETTDGAYSSGVGVPFQLTNHNLRAIDSPDTQNVWALGDFGLGLKYAAPSTALGVATASLPAGRVNQAYSTQFESVHGTAPMNWKVCGGALPPGVELQPNGHLIGTPTAAAIFRFVAAVFDNQGESAGKKFALIIEPEQGPTILTETLPSGEVGQEYWAVLEATGTEGPYEWALVEGELPEGLSLLEYGAIGGVPSLPGLFSVTLEVTDGQHPSGSARKEFPILIEGKIAPVPGPCDDLPFFCLALHWKDPGPIAEGDFDGDSDVDAGDVLQALRENRSR